MSGDSITQTLEEASQKVFAHIKTEGQDEADGEAREIYNYMIDWISNVNHSPKTVAKCIKWAEECIGMFPENDMDAIEGAKQTLVKLAAEYLAKKRPENISEQWLGIVEDVANLISEFDPEWKDCLDFSEEIVDWILLIFNTPKAWQNAELRLKMLWFIDILPKNIFNNPELGSRAASGLIDAGVQLEMEMLSPRGTLIMCGGICKRVTINIATPLFNVFEKLKKSGHLQIHANSAIEQLKDLQPGPELKFVAKITKLAGKLSIYVVCRFSKKGPSEALAIEMFARCISVLELVAGDSPFLPLAQMPGMCQLASSAMITIIDSILSLTHLCTNREDSVEILLLDLDNIFRHLIAIKKVFQEDHSVKIGDFQTKLNELNISLSSMPEPIPEKDIKDCPKEFLDAVTQSIMKAPVRLLGSGKDIDESTLIQLYLEDVPRDPFTRSSLDRNTCLPLPALKMKIQEWISNH